MSHTVTKLTIFNWALDELEKEHVTSENDTSAKGATLRNNWEFAFFGTLKAHDWSFATDYATLTLLSAATNLSPHERLYQLPTDLLKIQRVFDGDDDDVAHIVTAQGLFTDANPAYMQYTKKLDDANLSQYDIDFLKAVAYHLAELSAGGILGETAKEEFLEEKSGRMQGIAASQNVNRSPKQYKVESDWITVRNN
jgi:hypothetical protein